MPPQQGWAGNGWLPRTPDSLTALDLLLVQVAAPRVVHRDGIHFQGLRYLHTTLAGLVGHPVTIRYDPRDITTIRVFTRDRFLCEASSPTFTGAPITLKDIQTARTQHRRALRAEIATRRTAVAEFVPLRAPEATPTTPGHHRSRQPGRRRAGPGEGPSAAAAALRRRPHPHTARAGRPAGWG